MVSRRSSGFRRLFWAVLALWLTPEVGMAGGEVRMPGCEALAVWLPTVNAKDRWQPVEGSRAWLPKAFDTPEFTEMFGAPAMDWQVDDARAMAARLFECAKTAGKAERKVLLGGRSLFKNQLVAVLVTEQRAEAKAAREADRAAAAAEKETERKAAQTRRQERERAAREAQAAAQRDAAERSAAEVEEAVGAILALPDSLGLLEEIDALLQTNPRDPLGVNTIVGRYGPAAGRLLGVARAQRIPMTDPRIAGPLTARAEAVRQAVLAEQAGRIEALPATAEGLRFLDRWESEAETRIMPALGPEKAAELSRHFDARRVVIEEAVTGAVIARLEAASGAAEATAALDQLQQTLSDAGRMGLSEDRLEAIRARAAALEPALAGRALIERQAALASVPETVDGLMRLLRQIGKARRAPLSHAPAELREAYLGAAIARAARVADAALTEFEAGLTEAPDSALGLRMLDQTFVSEEPFGLLPPATRAPYEAALAARRDEIRSALDTAAEESRRRAIEAGGDPDLVGHRFVAADQGLMLGFVDEGRVVLELNGKRDVAPYRLDGGEIAIQGQGMVMRLTRRGEGGATELVWLGKVVLRRVGEQ